MALTPTTVIITFFLLINLAAFLILAYDKRKAVVGNTQNRTAEGFIFFLATVFGSIGVYTAMQLFRHKTRNWYFQIGIPMLILQNAAAVYLILEIFASH